MLKTVCLSLLASGILMSSAPVFAESVAEEDALTAEVIKSLQSDPVPSAALVQRAVWYRTDATYGSLSRVPLTVTKVAYVDHTAQMRQAQRMIEILSMQPAVLRNVTYHMSDGNTQTVCADVMYHTSGFGRFVGQLSHGRVVAFRLDATDHERNHAGCGDGSTRGVPPAVVAQAY